jgi:propionyl-CoA carboxylase alpha chain
VTARFDVGAGTSGIRVDSGVERGDQVPPYYDAMLAKVIAWAPDRGQAARMLGGALAKARVHGVTTNRDLLVNVLRHKAFVAGETDTAFLDRHGVESLAAPLVTDPDIAALAAAIAIDAGRPRLLRSVPSGWRNVPSQPQTMTIGDHDVRYRMTRDGLIAGEGIVLVSATPDEVVLDVHGVQRTFAVGVYDDEVYVDTATGGIRFELAPRFTDPAAQLAAGSLAAPMPGSVVRIAVSAGDSVRRGDPVLWLEAMKMQHRIDAPVAGTVADVPVRTGQQIETGTVLAVITEEEAQ